MTTVPCGATVHGDDLAIRESSVERGEEQVMGDGIGRQQVDAPQDPDRTRPALRQDMPRDLEAEARALDAERDDAED
jgi:hypothetical protein